MWRSNIGKYLHHVGKGMWLTHTTSWCSRVMCVCVVYERIKLKRHFIYIADPNYYDQITSLVHIWLYHRDLISIHDNSLAYQKHIQSSPTNEVLWIGSGTQCTEHLIWDMEFIGGRNRACRRRSEPGEKKHWVNCVGNRVEKDDQQSSGNNNDNNDAYCNTMPHFINKPIIWLRSPAENHLKNKLINNNSHKLKLNNIIFGSN